MKEKKERFGKPWFSDIYKSKDERKKERFGKPWFSDDSFKNNIFNIYYF